MLLEILDYVFAPTLTSEAIAYLKVLINDHHHKFKVLYPNSPITPKMHYIVHYPGLMFRLALIMLQTKNYMYMYFLQVWTSCTIMVHEV